MSGAVIVARQVRAVDERGYPSRRPAVQIRDPQPSRIALEDGILVCVEARGEFELQRRDIVRIVRIDRIGDADERLQVGRGFNGADIDGGDGVEHANFLGTEQPRAMAWNLAGKRAE